MYTLKKKVLERNIEAIILPGRLQLKRGIRIMLSSNSCSLDKVGQLELHM